MKYVKLYDDVFDSVFCENIIADFNAIPAQHDVVPEHRSFHVANLTESSMLEYCQPLIEGFKSVISFYLEDTETKEYQFPEKLAFEEMRMKKYYKGCDHFGEHVDVNGTWDNIRFLVFFLYLNDVEEGGETYFVDSNTKVKPKQGSVLVFPPTWTYPHAGLTPISSDKYIVGSYLHYHD